MESSVPAPDPRAREDVVAAALAAIRDDPSGVLLATDFDGVLSPIVPDPEQAYADERAVAAVARLAGLVGQVAVITGRSARTALRLGRLADRPGLERLVVLGQYGVERWDAATGRLDEPEPPAGLAAVRDALPALLHGPLLAQVWVEDKGRAVGLHTRRTSDPTRAFEALRDPVTRLAAEHGLHLEPGRHVWELRAPGHDKGMALRVLADECAARAVIYLGDDLGDLPAFTALAELRSTGLPTVGVWARSDEQTALAGIADVTVDGVAGVTDWLTGLAAEIIAATPPGCAARSRQR